MIASLHRLFRTHTIIQSLHYLLIAEEGSNSKWNPTESIIKILVPLFGPVFKLTVNPPTGVKEINFIFRI